MADIGDLALEEEELARAAALRSRPRPASGTSATHCRDCGEAIAEARRAAVITELCATCATELEELRRR